MNILMMTNTYSPHVGGVARSIEAFSNEYRLRGHNVTVIAPTFKNLEEDESNIIRIPAIQNFNGTDFSVALPIPGIISAAARKFKPDVIHSHHPFLIGSSALRIAHTYQIPIVFTHHTKYEEYTHYVPGDSKLLQQFVISLSTNYANLCDLIFTPSDSIRELIIERGVKSRIVTLPTGVDTRKYTDSNGPMFRKSLGIPENAFVIGHLGRLAREKNLEFLVDAVIRFMHKCPASLNCCFLLVGTGAMKKQLTDSFNNAGLSDRFFSAGILDSNDVVNAYSAMDLFVFSSKSETQGMVITEAMAAGTPVVAIDAAGVREVVKNNINGRLLKEPGIDDFCAAIEAIANLTHDEKISINDAAKNTADDFSLMHSADKALKCFAKLKDYSLTHRDKNFDLWTTTLRAIKSEWERVKEFSAAAESAMKANIKQHR
jgi:glycosyltransferase involved in cell wall biosynthesis